MRLKALLFKEWEDIFKVKWVIYGALILPLLMAGGESYVIYQARDLPVEAQAGVLITGLMMFLLIPVIVPTTIVVYSVVGEKEQKTLEPLLATPITTWEFFLGKALSGMIPAVLSTWVLFGIFLLVTQFMLGGIPSGVLTPTWLLSIFLLSPLFSLFSALVCMIISSRVTDPRAAFQFAQFAVALPLIPLIVYVARQTAASLALVALEGGVLILLTAVALYLAVRLFKREEILTRWK